ncbi:MAG: sodium:solute symporter family protein, partial [Myxococcales bacterium]|nr:sodium:solute symporter family protein [Myxococcales bacterium]
LGLVVMYFITGATIFSSFAFLGGPGFAYSKGAGVFYILGYGALGFVPFYFLGPRAARVGRKYGFVTQAEMVAHRFRSPTLAILMAVVSVIAFVPYLAIQMQGAGLVLEVVTRGALPMWAGALIVYLVVLAYVLKSGVLGVGWTNTLQGAFMLVLAWGLGLYLPNKLYGGVGPMFERIAREVPDHLIAPGPGWTWGQYSAAVIVSIAGFAMWPHLFMKAFSAKDERTLRRTVVLYPTFQLFLVPLFFIGFAGVLFSSAPARPDQILPHMLMNMDLPSVVVGLFCAGALAASMSSGDAMAHAAASIVIRDGYVQARGEPLGAHRERFLIRVVVVVMMVVSYLVALLAHQQGISLVKLLLSAYGAVVQFAPVVVATLYLRRVAAPALIAGLLVGSLVTVIFVVWPETMPLVLHAGLYGLVANLLVVAALARWGDRGPAEHHEAFLTTAAGGAVDE